MQTYRTFVGSAPAACLYFTAYDLANRTLAGGSSGGVGGSGDDDESGRNDGVLGFFQRNVSAAHLAAGFFAETISCVLWVPIDVVKERLQVQNSPHVHSSRVDVQKQHKHTPSAPTLTSPHVNASKHTPAAAPPVYHYRGGLHALRSIVAADGVRGL
jgi:hypothetical protein